MRIGRICSKEVMGVGPEDTLSRVTHLMRENHVGVVIVQEDGRPVGIVTDRDIAIRTGGLRSAVADIPVSEVMSTQVMTVSADDDVCVALERMREFGVRRLPVINEGGYLAGVVSLDDIVQHVARLMKRIGEVFQSEFANEARYDAGETDAAS